MTKAKLIISLLTCAVMATGLASCGGADGRSGNNSTGTSTGSRKDGIDLSNAKFAGISFSYGTSGHLSKGFNAIWTEDGELYMWGYNDHGQIGIGEKGGFVGMVKVMDNIKDVQLGDNFTVAVDKNGALYTWGYNKSGQLGNGSFEDSLSPVKVLDNVSEILVYKNSAMALLNNGELYIWGQNDSNFYGGVTEERTISSPLKAADNVNKIAKDSDPCVITNDHKAMLLGFTNEDDGSEGYIDAYYTDTVGFYGITANNQLKISRDTVLEKIKKVTSNDLYPSKTATYGALSTDGIQYMWGSNNVNQCGIVGEEYLKKPVENLKNIRDFWLEQYGGYAVDNNNTLYAWGKSVFGNFDIPMPIYSNVSDVKIFGPEIGVITTDGKLFIGGEYGPIYKENDGYTGYMTCLNDGYVVTELLCGNGQGKTKADNTDENDYNGVGQPVGFGTE